MIVRFKRPDSSIAWGWQTQQGIQDLCSADDSLPTSTRELILRWSEFESRIVPLIKKLGPTEERLELLCPLDVPGKILCIGLNYRDHALETDAPIPEEPIVFNKASTSLCGPNDPIEIPSSSSQVDFEAELVVVVGQRLKGATEEQAKRAIFGYTAGNDVSARDWQKGKPGKQWFFGEVVRYVRTDRSCDRFGLLDPRPAEAADRVEAQWPDDAEFDDCRVDFQARDAFELHLAGSDDRARRLALYRHAGRGWRGSKSAGLP